jgi:hypothetical protein
MKTLADNNVYVTIYSAGTTYERRTLDVLKISTGATRRSIWIGNFF